MPMYHISADFTTLGGPLHPEKDNIEIWTSWKAPTWDAFPALNSPALHVLDLENLQSNFFCLDLSRESLPHLDSSDESTTPSELSPRPHKDEQLTDATKQLEEDIWRSGPEISQHSPSERLLSWGQFLSPDNPQPRPLLLSEAGPVAFERALEALTPTSLQQRPCKIATPNGLVSALFQLAMGRESGLFEHDLERGSFLRRDAEFGLLGITVTSSDSFIAEFLAIGNSVKHVKDFAAREHTGHHQNLVRIALASFCSDILLATEQYLESHGLYTCTLLQLKQLVQRPATLYLCLQALVKEVEAHSNDHQLLANLLVVLQRCISEHHWLEVVLSRALSRIACPFISELQGTIGFSKMPVQEEPSAHSPLPIALETVLPVDLVESVAECRTSLKLLQLCQPNHTILNMSSDRFVKPSLSWVFTWEAVEIIRLRARLYEKDFQIFIAESRVWLVDRVDATHGAPLKVPHYEQATVDRSTVLELLDFDRDGVVGWHLGSSDLASFDELKVLIAQTFDPSSEPPDSLRPALSECLGLSLTPLIMAQHRLLSYCALQMLFQSYGLTSHLRLQHRFQLFGDGLFASRLSQALFDPALSSSEGRRKAAGTSGLRLQSRNTWPPASSEVRLALMGLLTESFTSWSTSAASEVSMQDDALTDSISFAIRDLSDEELDACRDADSIYALDFLRLQYKVPETTALDAIITPSSLRKYDRIFKHLLRILRIKTLGLHLMWSVCSRTFQNEKDVHLRFRLEVNHFISNLADYSQNIAVGTIWTRFMRVIEDVEEQLRKGDFDATIHQAKGITFLRNLHESCLNEMLRALFLDRRQVQALTVVEDLFTVILRFAATLRNSDLTKEDFAEVEKMQKEFRRGVSRLTRYLKAQADDAAVAPSGKHGDIGSDRLLFQQLLVRVNIFGYYD